MQTKEFSIIPKEGERGFIVGSTGSGKSAFAAWLLSKVTFSPIIIYDTKEDDKFPKLANSVIAYNEHDVNEAVNNPSYDYIIFRPDVRLSADPEALDNLLYNHYERYSRVGAYIDEAYQFHRSGRAFAGLVAILTRGRSRGITTLISSQRPSMLSRFVLTECQHMYVFHLSDYQDKKRISDIIPDFDNEVDPVEFGFHYYNVKSRALNRYGPVTIDKSFVGEYIQHIDPTHVVASPKKRIFI
jgi:DNA helicase HerA-like ATPase